MQQVGDFFTDFHLNHINSVCVCVCVCVLVTQLCLTLYNPVDCSPPGFSVNGIPQARMLEWVATSSSRGPSPPGDRNCGSYISCIGRWIFLPLVPPGKSILIIDNIY